MLAKLGRLTARTLPPLHSHQQQVHLIPRCAFARVRRTPLSRNAGRSQPQRADVEEAADEEDDAAPAPTPAPLPSSSSRISSSSSKPKAQPPPQPPPGETPAWNWVPPREPTQVNDDEVIPVIDGAYLTAQEITTALAAQGAENVVVVPLQPKIETIAEFVIASGRSTRHLRKMSDSLVRALQARRLRQAMGSKGAEGEKDDDWLLVDCHNIVVHLMLPATRQAVDLEALWRAQEQDRPLVVFSHDEDKYERHFEALLERFPVPPGYGLVSESFGMEKKPDPKAPPSPAGLGAGKGGRGKAGAAPDRQSARRL